MKTIKEMPAEKAFDVMARLAPFVYSINGDEIIAEAKEQMRSATDTYENRKDFFSRVLPVILRDHAGDIFGMLALLEETTVEDIRSRPYEQIADMINKAGISELIGFFRFAMRILAAI